VPWERVREGGEAREEVEQERGERGRGAREREGGREEERTD